MIVLTVNAGSSSLRLAAYIEQDQSLSLLASVHYSGDSREPAEILKAFLKDHGDGNVTAVAHRVVHGGPRLTASCVVNDAVEAEIRRLAPLAPLHNPVALNWIAACRAALGTQVTQVAVFDTAFYSALPEVAATYALPRGLSLKHGVRRYGFHGLAHQAMSRRWGALHPEAGPGANVITLQLGAGCSITAVRDGHAVDTSMGFSPLEGLVMATRSGDIDPGLLLYLQRAEGLTPERMEKLLNTESGLLGVSAASGDMRQLLAAQDEAARFAVEFYCYRARKYVGSFLAALGGAQAIVFGGGVGEHAPPVREKILAGMQRLGIALDSGANSAAIGTEALISRNDSEVEVWVIPVDEARILAEEAVAVVRPATARSRKE